IKQNKIKKIITKSRLLVKKYKTPIHQRNEEVHLPIAFRSRAHTPDATFRPTKTRSFII
ncbi:hypothetical protein HYPBUDRAFT_12142, partial [Hyphopichia burtonii NRRL Y-1933]